MDSRVLTRWRSRFLRTAETARFLGLSVRTLEKYRRLGIGPKFRKFNGRVAYAIEDVQSWADRAAKNSTSDPGLGNLRPAKAKMLAKVNGRSAILAASENAISDRPE